MMLFFFKEKLYFFLSKLPLFPVVHFKILYITSDLGPFLSPYITLKVIYGLFEARILLLKVIYRLFGARILPQKYIWAQNWTQLAQSNIRTPKMYHWVGILTYAYVGGINI